MHFSVAESSCGEDPVLANPDKEKLIQKVLDMTAIPDVGQSATKSQGKISLIT